MRRFALSVARRLVVALATLWLVSVVIFATVEVFPKDPAFAALGHESTPAQRQAFRHVMHLDDPPIARYERWLGGFVRGDLGVSTISAQPVGGEIATRLKYTSILAIGALAVSLALSVPLAVFVARRPGGKADTLLSGAAVAASALPEYVIGLGLMLVLASWLGLLPAVSGDVVSGSVTAYVLPILTLACVGGAYVFRFARVSLIETSGAPFVRSAVLRGFSPRRVLWRHVMPNAAVAVVNVIALNAIYLFGGVIVVENLFGYPGLGQLLVAAVNAKDFPMIEAAALVMSAFVIVTNLLADACVVALNPRLRATGN